MELIEWAIIHLQAIQGECLALSFCLFFFSSFFPLRLYESLSSSKGKSVSRN